MPMFSVAGPAQRVRLFPPRINPFIAGVQQAMANHRIKDELIELADQLGVKVPKAYRLINEGEQKPTGITGTPLGSKPALATGAPPAVGAVLGSECRPEDTSTHPTTPPPHQGVLATYVDKSGNRFGVDVLKMNRSWARIRIMATTSALKMMIGTERQVGPDKLSPVQSGDWFWWRWPNADHYDYAGKLDELRSRVGRR